MAPASEMADIGRYEPDFRQDYESNFANSGYSYDQYRRSLENTRTEDIAYRAVRRCFPSGVISGRRPSLYGGISLASLGFITQVAHAIEAFRPSGWLALAGLGLGVVALTAWLERRARAARTEGAGVKMSQDPAATLSQ